MLARLVRLKIERPALTATSPLFADRWTRTETVASGAGACVLPDGDADSRIEEIVAALKRNA